MIIELKGVQFVNKGAELMLHAMLQQLREYDPTIEVCMAPDNNSSYVRRAQIGALQKLHLRKNIIDLNGLSYLLPISWRRVMKNKFGIVTEADIDVILDASGFAYGDQWKDLILHQVAQEVRRFKRKNKPYVFMPQSLGPFTREENKKWAKVAFGNARLVFARETPSLNHLNELVKGDHIHQAPDFTNLVNASLPQQYAYCADTVILIPNSKMLSSRNADKRWQAHYVELLAALAGKAQEQGERIIILNHSGYEDKALCEEIRAQLANPADIIEPPDALTVKAIIGNAKGIICSRFHGCVSALSQGIPCLATGWSHKYKELFAEYESSDYLLVPDVSEQALERAINLLLNPRGEYLERLTLLGAEYKAQSQAMWSKVHEILAPGSRQVK